MERSAVPASDEIAAFPLEDMERFTSSNAKTGPNGRGWVQNRRLSSATTDQAALVAGEGVHNETSPFVYTTACSDLQIWSSEGDAIRS